MRKFTFTIKVDQWMQGSIVPMIIQAESPEKALRYAVQLYGNSSSYTIELGPKHPFVRYKQKWDRDWMV